MMRHPKRYGGMERDLEEISRGGRRPARNGRGVGQRPERSDAPRRASEAEIWEREESLDDDEQDQDGNIDPERTELEELDRPGSGRSRDR